MGGKKVSDFLQINYVSIYNILGHGPCKEARIHGSHLSGDGKIATVRFPHLASHDRNCGVSKVHASRKV